MHVAVEKDAAEGLTFYEYVQYLIDEGYSPTGSDDWLDYIRTRGNEANHEILLMDADDAEALISLTEQLLRNVYELPTIAARFKQKAADKAAASDEDDDNDAGDTPTQTVDL